MKLFLPQIKGVKKENSNLYYRKLAFILFFFNYCQMIELFSYSPGLINLWIDRDFGTLFAYLIEI